MKLTTNAPDALAEAHRPWAAVIGVKRMIRTMIDDGFQAHAGVGADAAAVAGRDQRNLGDGAASLAVGILEAAPLLHRQSVVEGKRVSVRVTLGGWRIIKKTTNLHQKTKRI